MAFKILPAISFQNFESKSLEKIRQLAFKILPAICFQKAFKNFPAICFQKFSSDLLSKSFQKFSSDLLSKLWKQIAWKNLPASFQIFESYLKAILSRENQDGRHQGNHRHNALD